MTPQPDSDLSNYNSANKLTDKVAFITGGDSVIGRAIAIAYAMEATEVVIFYAERNRLLEQSQKRQRGRGLSR